MAYETLSEEEKRRRKREEYAFLNAARHAAVSGANASENQHRASVEARMEEAENKAVRQSDSRRRAATPVRDAGSPGSGKTKNASGTDWYTDGRRKSDEVIRQHTIGSYNQPAASPSYSRREPQNPPSLIKHRESVDARMELADAKINREAAERRSVDYLTKESKPSGSPATADWYTDAHRKSEETMRQQARIAAASALPLSREAKLKQMENGYFLQQLGLPRNSPQQSGQWPVGIKTGQNPAISTNPALSFEEMQKDPAFGRQMEELMKRARGSTGKPEETPGSVSAPQGNGTLPGTGSNTPSGSNRDRKNSVAGQIAYWDYFNKTGWPGTVPKALPSSILLTDKEYALNVTGDNPDYSIDWSQPYGAVKAVSDAFKFLGKSDSERKEEIDKRLEQETVTRNRKTMDKLFHERNFDPLRQSIPDALTVPYTSYVDLPPLTSAMFKAYATDSQLKQTGISRNMTEDEYDALIDYLQIDTLTSTAKAPSKIAFPDFLNSGKDEVNDSALLTDLAAEQTRKRKLYNFALDYLKETGNKEGLALINRIHERDEQGYSALKQELLDYWVTFQKKRDEIIRLPNDPKLSMDTNGRFRAGRIEHLMDPSNIKGWDYWKQDRDQIQKSYEEAQAAQGKTDNIKTNFWDVLTKSVGLGQSQYKADWYNTFRVILGDHFLGSDLVGSLMKEEKDQSESWDYISNASPVEQGLSKLISSFTYMTPTLAMDAMASFVGGPFGTVMTAGSNIQSFLTSWGGYARQAELGGADRKQQILYATLGAYMEFLCQAKAPGQIQGLGKNISKLGAKKFMKQVGTKALQYTKNKSFESVKNNAPNIFAGLLEKGLWNPDKKFYGKGGIVDPEQIDDNNKLSAVMCLIINACSLPSSYKSSRRASRIAGLIHENKVIPTDEFTSLGDEYLKDIADVKQHPEDMAAMYKEAEDASRKELKESAEYGKPNRADRYAESGEREPYAVDGTAGRTPDATERTPESSASDDRPSRTGAWEPYPDGEPVEKPRDNAEKVPDQSNAPLREKNSANTDSQPSGSPREEAPVSVPESSTRPRTPPSRSLADYNMEPTPVSRNRTRIDYDSAMKPYVDEFLKTSQPGETTPVRRSENTGTYSAEFDGDAPRRLEQFLNENAPPRETADALRQKGMEPGRKATAVTARGAYDAVYAVVDSGRLNAPRDTAFKKNAGYPKEKAAHENTGVPAIRQTKAIESGRRYDKALKDMPVINADGNVLTNTGPLLALQRLFGKGKTYGSIDIKKKTVGAMQEYLISKDTPMPENPVLVKVIVDGTPLSEKVQGTVGVGGNNGQGRENAVDGSGERVYNENKWIRDDQDLLQSDKFKNSFNNVSANYLKKFKPVHFIGTVKVNGVEKDITRRVYQRKDIDFNFKDPESGKNNLERMLEGKPPIGIDGKPIQLHHLIQQEVGPLVEIFEMTHKEYYKTLHGLIENGESFRNNQTLSKQYKNFRSKYWKWRALQFIKEVH